MTTTIESNDYNDFKAVLNAVTSKGTVFYFTTTGNFKAGFLASDLSCWVQLIGLTTTPANFASDFPNAIAVANGNIGGTTQLGIG